MKEELGPWRQLVQSNVAKLEVGATFKQNVVYNPVGAKAMAELLVVMADKLDGLIKEVEEEGRNAAHKRAAEEAASEEVRREVVRSLRRYTHWTEVEWAHRSYECVCGLYRVHHRKRSLRTKLSRALARMFGR